MISRTNNGFTCSSQRTAPGADADTAGLAITDAPGLEIYATVLYFLFVQGW